MKFIQKIKTYFQHKKSIALLEEKITRMERNYLILLKRVLEIDGVQLKTAAFSNKVLQTPRDEFNKGLNEPKPTIH